MEGLKDKQSTVVNRPNVGYSIESSLNLSEEDIITGAKFIGDLNPIHIDPENENTLKFGGVVASGSHVTAVFSALLPTDFVKFAPMLGAHMDVKFTAPIKPNTNYKMLWVVDSLEYKKSLRGTVYNMVGTVFDPTGKVTVRANASIILY